MDIRLLAFLTLFILSLSQASFAQAGSAHKKPLFLVHGSGGTIENFAGLLESTPQISSYEVSYFAYDDSHDPLAKSGEDLAWQILGTHSPEVTVLAHSMGGLVAREALNFLSGLKFVSPLPKVRVISIDTPWQGGTMKLCKSKGNPIDRIISRALPPGIRDMRSCSDFFESVYSVRWPPQLTLEVYFASEGTQALDYSEPALAQIPQKIADNFNYHIVISGNYYEMNFWQALSSSAQYPGFVREATQIQRVSQLTAYDIKELLEKYFPRFPGNHVSVLTKHPEAPQDFPAYLQQIL